VYKTPNIKKRVTLILGATLLFMAGLGAFLFWYLGGQEDAAEREANKFISALEKNKPSAAPENGDDYVRGVWRAYRRVDSAELIDTHQRSSRSSSARNSGSSWWVADILLRTGRGLAVVELAFERNNLDPDEQVIDLLYELTPDRIPGGVLDDKTLARVKSDQGERGGKVEDGITLSVSESEVSSGPRPRAPKPGAPASPASPGAPASPATPAKPKQPAVIKCIRRARGDVNKLKKCARLA
jgi:hypothetical protein